MQNTTLRVLPTKVYEDDAPLLQLCFDGQLRAIRNIYVDDQYTFTTLVI